MMHPLTLTPIGLIRTPFSGQAGTPIQPAFARDAEGREEVAPRYEAALADIEGHERIWAGWWDAATGPGYRADARFEEG